MIIKILKWNPEKHQYEDAGEYIIKSFNLEAYFNRSEITAYVEDGGALETVPIKQEKKACCVCAKCNGSGLEEVEK